MAVQEQTPYIEYTANGVATSFALEFDCENKDHLIVTLDGDEPPVGEWSLIGGAVVFIAAPASGSIVAIQRNTPFSRSTDYQSYNNSFRPGPVNEDFDAIWFKLQELGYADWLVNQKIAQEILDRIAADEQMLDYILNQDNALKADYISRDAALKQYIDQMIALVTGDPSFSGITADFVFDTLSGKTQQEINNQTARHVSTITVLLSILNKKDGDIVHVDSYNPVNYALAIPYFAKGGGLFKYDASKSTVNDGGVILNGWVRQNFSEINVYMFGAYGNWDTAAQTGDDDTIPFQKAVDFLVANGGNIRTSGNRYIKAPVGSFKLSGFTVPQLSAYFSFNMIGEGQFTRLWLDPTGNPIDIQCENAQFKNMIINGKLTQGYPSVGDPAINYCIKHKLANKLLDCDLILDGVDFSNFSTAVRLSGRGFTFRNGGAGFGGDTLCEIACDSDLVVAGDTATIHSLETSMRHFSFSNSRIDQLPNLFKVTGVHALKDYINGLSVHNSELTGLGRLVISTDCTLVSPKFTSNVAIGCFSGNSEGMVYVPRIKDALDQGNKWFNYIAGTFTLSNSTGIRYLYRCTDIDGLTIDGTTAKDIIFGIAQATASANNVKILNSNFPAFGNLQNNTTPIDTGSVIPTNCEITGNTFTDNGNFTKKWISAPTGGVTSVVIKDNVASDKFPVQALQYTPKIRVNNTDSLGATYSQQFGNYWIEGNYVHVRVGITATETGTSGGVGISLPVPAIGEFTAISSYISGSGVVTTLTNFNVTNSILVAVSANTDQTAKFMVSPSTQLNLSQKTSNSTTINCEFKYRFK